MKIKKAYRRRMKKCFMLIGMLLLVGCSSVKKEKGPGIFEYDLQPYGENRLAVTLKVTNPPTSARRKFRFPEVGEHIELEEWEEGEGWEETEEGEESEALEGPVLWVDSGKTKELKYYVNLGEDGKHGMQGAATDEFCSFDGLHTLLLSEEAYREGLSNEEVLMEQLSVKIETAKGWTAVNPFKMKKDVTWADLYDLTNDCFAMGNFNMHTLSVENGKLNIYFPPEEKWPQEDFYEKALKSLFSYYINLFQIEKEYDIVFLPDEKQMIGGAGRHSVGASFNPENARDWELLSHRMFHAFLDSSLQGQTIHKAPLLWFAEGLATYYENIALQQMPESMRAAYGWEEDLQFAKLYDQYLYMRWKEPLLYQIAPMEEEGLKSQAQVEFLHYIQAPLMVKKLETTAGNDSVLHEFLKSYKWDSFSMEDMAKELLGTDFEKTWKDFFIGKEDIPLWELGEAARDNLEVMEHLNAAEEMLGSWLNAELEYYPIEKMSEEELETLKKDSGFGQSSYADLETEKKIRKYSKLIDELLKANCLKIKKAGCELGDPMARYKYLKDMVRIGE